MSASPAAKSDISEAIAAAYRLLQKIAARAEAEPADNPEEQKAA